MRPQARSVFALVFALMVVDFVDRQVVVSMFPHLKAQWNLSDAQLGALVSVIAIVVAIGTVPLSLLADRWSRVKSMFVMALVWSCATIACAFAQSYAELLAARALVGVGEAAYGSVGAALLASLFPARMRSLVVGTFLAAAVVGSVLGVLLGGIIAQHWSWRAGFGLVGIPGIVLAVVFLVLARDYRTVSLPVPKGAHATARAIARALLQPRTAPIACIAAGLQLVMVSTTYAWLPSYLNRFYGLSPDRAGAQTAIVILLGGVGCIASSAIADRLTTRLPSARLYVPAVAALASAAAMFTAFALLSPGTAQFLMIVVGATIMTGTVGPTCAAVIDVVHPAVRATAAAMLALTQNLFGLAAGPVVTGLLSDAYGLSVAMSVVPIFCVAAAGVFLLAARTYAGDARDARTYGASAELETAR